MYNINIYKGLNERFGPFNMLLISQGIAEMYRLIYESNKKEKDAHFNHLWWLNAEENAAGIIDEEIKPIDL